MKAQNMFKKLKIKFRNLFCKAQICEKCGKDLLKEPEHGFEQLEHCGMGKYKIRSAKKFSIYSF